MNLVLKPWQRHHLTSTQRSKRLNDLLVCCVRIAEPRTQFTISGHRPRYGNAELLGADAGETPYSSHDDLSRWICASTEIVGLYTGLPQEYSTEMQGRVF
jgi:hypothetical protein